MMPSHTTGPTPPRRNMRTSAAPARMSGVNLGRVSWLVTVIACLVTAAILLLEGYYGYAGVTLAVALSAFINLF
jgi:ABC-type Fe3+-siderophore transport system permease subunit